MDQLLNTFLDTSRPGEERRKAIETYFACEKRPRALATLVLDPRLNERPVSRSRLALGPTSPVWQRAIDRLEQLADQAWAKAERREEYKGFRGLVEAIGVRKKEAPRPHRAYNYLRSLRERLQHWSAFLSSPQASAQNMVAGRDVSRSDFQGKSGADKPTLDELMETVKRQEERARPLKESLEDPFIASIVGRLMGEGFPPQAIESNPSLARIWSSDPSTGGGDYGYILKYHGVSQSALREKREDNYRKWQAHRAEVVGSALPQLEQDFARDAIEFPPGGIIPDPDCFQ